MSFEANGGAVAYIGLGSNLGASAATLDAAFDAIGRLPQTRLVARSSLYASAPVDAVGPDFVNAVACVRTTLAPRALLAHLLGIESAHGRERSGRNAPRTLDLDLLLYGSLRIDEPGLVVPHPRMQERAFVLAPLVEIAPQLEIPGLGRADALLLGVAGQRIARVS